MSNLTVLPMLA